MSDNLSLPIHWEEICVCGIYNTRKEEKSTMKMWFVFWERTKVTKSRVHRHQQKKKCCQEELEAFRATGLLLKELRQLLYNKSKHVIRGFLVPWKITLKYWNRINFPLKQKSRQYSYSNENRPQLQGVYIEDAVISFYSII